MSDSEGTWVDNRPTVLNRFLALARPNVTPSHVCNFIRQEGPIEIRGCFPIGLDWPFGPPPVHAVTRSSDASISFSDLPRIPADLVLVREYHRLAKFVDGIVRIAEALHAFEVGGGSKRSNWAVFSQARDVPAALKSLDVVGIWREAQAEARRLRSGPRLRTPAARDRSCLPEALALQSAVRLCFSVADVKLRPRFDWLGSELWGLGYSILNTWDAICFALVQRITNLLGSSICRGCGESYQPSRKQGRPRALCQQCFTPEESRRISARLSYRRRVSERTALQHVATSSQTVGVTPPKSMIPQIARSISEKQASPHRRKTPVETPVRGRR